MSQQSLAVSYWSRFPSLLVIKQYAEVLGVTTRTATQQLDDGLVRATKWGTTWYIDRADLIGFLAQDPRGQKYPRARIVATPEVAPERDEDFLTGFGTEVDSASLLRLLGVTSPTLDRWIREEEFPEFDRAGGNATAVANLRESFLQKSNHGPRYR
ncbi:hypothetical protein GCM10027515_30010 [Schumannella luteola]|uniref:Excisionase family DNA binding protein n=1 Tax=Schumannella luteola TaxID=472059 RepID=A0A852YJ98_9MICO|nr:helix-turn-helix domain-containing protein [Schumannella luteola]NYG99198.1 excisionase family DNA binding protein [Schumannella luteola]TPX02510.1 helix-turn-helix domain-containing protein [Schumannella luteola]